MQQPLLLFVHGFMGSSQSFLDFPKDLAHTLNAGFQHYEYDTKGEYTEKTRRLGEFLAKLPHSQIFILAHSMGGLISIDCCAQNSYNVKGILSFDSPFFGLDPLVTKAGASRAQDAIQSVSSYLPKSSSWGMLAMGVAAVGAIALSQPKVTEAISTTLRSHSDQWRDRFQFLGPLWDAPGMNTRFEGISSFPFQFHGLYLEVLDID
jgi:pimeloyl-ACP methyl ester carboxylesterase